jgi:16S rRNA G527 N7-methylase RsmG
MDSVEVRAERVREFARVLAAPCYDTATARAVGNLDALIPQALGCLAPGGRLVLWLTHVQAQGLQRSRAWVDWSPPIPVPLARQREIWLGTRAETER